MRYSLPAGRVMALWLSVFFKIIFKTKKACMFVDDMKLRGITTEVSDRIGIKSCLDK